MIVKMDIVLSYTFEDVYNVRVKTINGNVWLCARDVCEVLGLKNSREATAKLKTEQKTRVRLGDTNSRDFTFISKTGLYRLIFDSHKPKALDFQCWICEEVIPSIEKTGKYELAPATPEWRERLEFDKETRRQELALKVLSNPATSRDNNLVMIANEALGRALLGNSNESTFVLKDISEFLAELDVPKSQIAKLRSKLGKVIKQRYTETYNIEPPFANKLVNGATRSVRSYPPEHYADIKTWLREALEELGVRSQADPSACTSR